MVVVLFLLELHGCDDHAGEGQECDDIGNDHDIVEHIGQLPNQIIGEQGAEEDEHHCQHRVDHGCLFAEQVFHVLLAEEVPTDDGGECEEHQADGHKDIAQCLVAQSGSHCQLHHIGFGEHPCDAVGCKAELASEGASSCVQGGDDHKGGDGENHEGINEYADHGDHTLIVGLFHLCLCVCVGGGAHACFIGEEASFDALADGRFDGRTEGTAQECVGHKGVFEDHGEGFWDIFKVDAEDHKAENQVEDSHQGDDLFGHRRDPLNAADEDDGTEHCQHQADDPRCDMEGSRGGFRDGVGLNHGAHEAQCQDNGHCEEAGQKLAEFVLECVFNIVDGASENGAVLLHHAGLLCQDCLCIDGCHAEEGDDPHPEDGTRAADENGTARTDNIACAYLCRNGGCQCLEGRESALFFAALEGQIAEYLFHALAEATHLHEACADRVEQAGSHQEEDQNIIRQVLIDILDDGE